MPWSDDGFGAFFEGGDAGLEFEDVFARGEGEARDVGCWGGLAEGAGGGRGLDVEARGESALAGAGKEDGADIRIV
jgi:hypothetical protein